MKRRRLRVLVVEDDKENRTVFGIYLTHLGIDAAMVSDGLQALEEIPVVDPDVILLDLRMPNMDGWTFLEKYSGPVPVIIVSAYSDMTNLPRKPFAIVMKPTDMREVAKLVKRAAASWRDKP